MAFIKFLLTDFTFKNRDCSQTIYELVSRGKYHRIGVMDGESSGDFRGVQFFRFFTSSTKNQQTSQLTTSSDSIVLMYKQYDV